VGVVFVIVWGLCLLMYGGCVCYFEGCVRYCVVAVFVTVIFVWLFELNNVVWDKIGEVGASSGVICANLRLVHWLRDCLIC